MSSLTLCLFVVAVWICLTEQNTAGSGLPRRHGGWKSRGESEEDQTSKNVGALSLPSWIPCISCVETDSQRCQNNFWCFLSHCFPSYVMTSGYKPAPLDLSHVKLTPNQNQLVEKLAENGHNVWARDRVRQGWTYSIVQVFGTFSLFSSVKGQDEINKISNIQSINKSNQWT